MYKHKSKILTLKEQSYLSVIGYQQTCGAQIVNDEYASASSLRLIAGAHSTAIEAGANVLDLRDIYKLSPKIREEVEALSKSLREVCEDDRSISEINVDDFLTGKTTMW